MPDVAPAFKALRGKHKDLPAGKEDGNVYFCTDEGMMYVDYADADGAVQRTQIYGYTPYSTDEHACGAWIDGKTFYRKTLVFDADFSDHISSNTTANKQPNWVYYQFDKPYVDKYIKVEGTAHVTSRSSATHAAEFGITDPGQWQPIPRVCPDACEDYSIGFGDFVSDEIGVLFGYLYYTATVYLTIEYTRL